jgi:hypothetical protein
MSSGFAHRLLGWFTWLGYILVSLLVIALGEWLPLMPAVQRFQETHPVIDQVLTGITLGMTILGTLLLVFTQFLVRVPDPRPTAQSRTIKTKGNVKSPGRFFSGIMISAGFSDEARMWRLMRAFRDGEWWRVPRWRRFTLMMLGAILLFYGLFGLLFLLSPPGLKLLLFLVVVYATGRSVYAFMVDRPFRKRDGTS